MQYDYTASIEDQLDKIAEAQLDYKSMLESRKLDEVDYQVEFWSNPVHQSPDKPLVLAAGTSSGKTTMTIGHLEIFYSDDTNKSAKTLIIPSATMVLRENFAESLEAFGPTTFNYCICNNVQETIDALNDPNCQVVVSLPQAVTRIPNLPKLEWFILDEAQEWYGKSTIKKIIKKSKPTYQLLLTGTPFKFHRNKNKFLFYYVSVEELYERGRVGNPRIEVVSTSYDVRLTDYNEFGNITKDFTSKNNKEALWAVAEHMVKHMGLPEPIKKQFLANRMTNKILSVFGEVDPTIIYCSRTKQANQFYKIFDTIYPGQVLMSHSHNDDDSKEFQLFQEGNHKVLISVNRGRIGFDMPELFNIVDFTMTTNVDMLLQLMGRLLRLSKKKKTQKVYYKVASNNDVGYIKQLMTGVLSLWMKNLYQHYSGDAREIRIPRITPTKPRGKQDKQPTTRPAVNRRALSNFLEMGVLSLEFWKEILHYNNDKFATVAWTTLGEVRREFYNIRGTNFLTKEFYDATVKEHKITHFKQLANINLSLAVKASNEGWDSNLIKKQVTVGDGDYSVEGVLQFIKDHKITEFKQFTGISKGQVMRRHYKQYVEEGLIDDICPKGKRGLRKGHKYDDATKEKLSRIRKEMWDNGHYDNFTLNKKQ